MRFINSCLKQSFAACLIILCLICFICLTSAYFTTFNMAAMDDGHNCPSGPAPEEEQNCDTGADSAQTTKQLGSLSDNPSDRHSDSHLSDSIGGASENMGGRLPRPSTDVVSLKDKYIASMVLSGVGDALGYHNGRWEFDYDGESIHKELHEEFGGLSKLKLTGKKWIVSDDTVMHLATAEALVEFGNKTVNEDLYKILAKKYIECMDDMADRAPGPTCIQGVNLMKRKHTHTVPFNSRGGGCGAAMRAMCIGLRYPKKEDIDDLTAVSIESGRMTHHHPTGYLGAFAGALFTSYAIQGKQLNSWGKGLMTELKRAKDYVKEQGRDVDANLEKWSYFEDAWKNYLAIRGISDGTSNPVFPDVYDVAVRDEFYKNLSFSGWGGSSGHDAPMIAYDALLGSNGSWLELCLRGMLHGGDNDSTGTMAGAWFGALYGFQGVPEQHYKKLEYVERLEKLGLKLYKLSWPNETAL